MRPSIEKKTNKYDISWEKEGSSKWFFYTFLTFLSGPLGASLYPPGIPSKFNLCWGFLCILFPLRFLFYFFNCKPFFQIQLEWWERDQLWKPLMMHFLAKLQLKVFWHLLLLFQRNFTQTPTFWLSKNALECESISILKNLEYFPSKNHKSWTTQGTNCHQITREFHYHNLLFISTDFMWYKTRE